MLKVALTGGIATGKTTAANLFHQLGVDIIDADIIAREITAPNTVAEATIIEKFGANLVTTNGILDRKKCRELVFLDAKKKQWLEEFLHPKIRENIREQIGTVRSAYCLLVIPLLVESNHYEYIDRICVINVDPEIQQQRAMTRDHATAEHIKRITQAQANQAERLKIADDIITNNDNRDHLYQQVKQLNQLYLELSTTY
jgi:dephospho-CoA kinase